MRARLVPDCLGLALLVLSIVACGSGDDRGASTKPFTTGSERPESAEPTPEPRKAAPLLERAVRQIASRRGRVTARIRLDGLDGYFVTESVVYSVKDEALNATRVMVDPTGGQREEDTYTANVRARGEAAFIQMPRWDPPTNRCWLALSGADVATAGLDLAALQKIPNAVAAVLEARPASGLVDGSGEMAVRIPGTVALGLLGVGARALFELDLPRSVRAPATIVIDDDNRIRALLVDGPDIAHAMDGSLSQDLHRFVPALSGEYLFEPDDPSITLQPPAAAEIMTDFKEGCAASR